MPTPAGGDGDGDVSRYLKYRLAPGRGDVLLEDTTLRMGATLSVRGIPATSRGDSFLGGEGAAQTAVAAKLPARRLKRVGAMATGLVE